MSDDSGDILGTEERNKKIKEVRERLDRRKRENLAWVASTKKGQEYLMWELMECGIWRSSFSPNSNQTAFNEGRRDIGLALVALMDEVDPNLFPKLQRDYFSELKSKETQNA